MGRRISWVAGSLNALGGDLVADPMAIAQTIYDTFSFDLSERTEAALHSFLTENRQHKHGVHRYGPEEFGLSAAQIRERFSE